MDKERKYTVLCVDDEKNILKSLERTLRSDYRVITAVSGNEGLELLKKEMVDLIIADQRMPQMSGAEFLRMVRKDYPNVVCIMLSGYSDFDSLVKSINEGEIFRFLYKPWNDKELKDVIQNALEHKRVLNIVEDLIRHICQIVQLSENISVDTESEQTCISLKVGKEGQVYSEEIISKFINFIFDSLGTEKDKDVKIVSSAITRQKDRILILIDIGKGLSLKIELPWVQKEQ